MTLTHIEEATVKKQDGTFAQGLCFYKLVWVFALCSVLGVIVETLFCFLFKGYFESRQGMLYGPFNQVYGFGGVMLALALHRVSRKGIAPVFVVSALMGGVFEVVCSAVQQHYLGSVSWDYNWMPFAIGGGRTNLLYVIFFGILGISFVRVIYPCLSNLIERIHLRQGVIVTWVIIGFMTINLGLSAVVVFRWTQRQQGTPPSSSVDRFVDLHYSDETLTEIFPSMMVVG